MRKVLVTGIGMITALGASKDKTFDALLNSKSGVGSAPDFVTRWLPNALAAHVKDNIDERLARNEISLDRATKLALLAAREAIGDAQLSLTPEEKNSVGVFTGIGMAGAQTLDGFYTTFYERLESFLSQGKDPTVMHPLLVPRIMANSTAAHVSIENGFRGPTQTYSVACSSSAIAIGEAYRTIQSGRAEAVVVIGSEAMIVPGPFMAWHALRVMASPRKDSVSASCRPFDRERCGFTLGEGAAALVLESEDSAMKRGRKAYARICGYGSTSDASHITLPSVDGQARAMQLALQESGLPLDAIGYVNAHGTATEAGDIVETNSIKTAFQGQANRLAISSTKSMHGHLIGAAGALEFAVSIMAMRTGSIPPTANLENQDERCDLDYVPRTARHGCDLHAVMSNSFAFGGSNVSLIACRPT